VTANRLTILLASLVLLVSCAKVVNYDTVEGPLYFASSTTAPARSGDTLTIVTYNIEFASKIDEAIADLSMSDSIGDADLILLQEMDYKGVARIARTLSYNFVYYPAVKRPENDRDFGNAILSKWPLREPEKVILPNLKPVRKMQRIATFTIVSIGDREVLVSSAHLEMFVMGRDRRVEQVDSLSRSIPENADYVIVGGDFNSFRTSTLTVFDSLMTMAGLHRATGDDGWTAAFAMFGIFKFKLDHIYLKGLRAVDNGIVYGTRGSDHRPVWVKAVWDDDSTGSSVAGP
jgi:endonuclease/exonuclease/phosphatase family metal-dependent hydrolase